MSDTSVHFLLLPGLGADLRLFAQQQRVFSNLDVPEWMPPDPGESLARYAVRFAAQVSTKRPLILGGCSFGGMVAYEMARVLHPEALVLIGSAIGPMEIPMHVRWLSRLSPVLPVRILHSPFFATFAMARLFGLWDKEHQAVAIAMLHDSPAEFIRWACASIAYWDPRPLMGVPIYTMHGGKDRVLPLCNRSVDLIVPGAGHLLPISDGESVNTFLRDLERQVREKQEVRP